MWNIFINIILGCLGVLAIFFTTLIVIGIIYSIVKQIKKK